MLEERLTEALSSLGDAPVEEEVKADSKFRARTRVDLLVPNGWILDEHDEVVVIPYDIDVDWKSWGIKGFSIIVGGVMEIDYRASTEDESDIRSGKAIVDLSKIKREQVDGPGVRVDNLAVYLNPDWSVDYERSSLSVLM